MAIWYEVEKTVEGIKQARECNYDFHDYRLEKIDYVAAWDAVEIFLMYDSREDGLLLRFAHVKDMHVNVDVDYHADWLDACDIFLLKDGTLLFVVGTDEGNPDYQLTDELRHGLTWVQAERIFWAMTNAKREPIELPADRIDDTWVIYGEKVEKHFELKEFDGDWESILRPRWE